MGSRSGVLPPGRRTNPAGRYVDGSLRCKNLSSIPFTNWAECPLPNRLASSTASLIAARSGVSVYRISYVAEAQYVAVGRSHAGDAPIIGDRGKLRVHFTLIAADAQNKRHAKFFEVRRVQSAVDERFHFRDGRARVYVILKQDLQGNFAGT